MNQRILSAILIASLGTLFFYSCSSANGPSHEDHKENTGSSSKKSNLPQDPCGLSFLVFSTLNKGPENLRAATMTYDEYTDIKKNYPDLERLYNLQKDFDEQRKPYDPVAYGGRFNYDNPLLLMFNLEQSHNNESSLKDALNKMLEDYYESLRSAAREQAVIWDELRLNECNTEQYFLFSDDTYTYAGESFKLPEMKFVNMYVVINGEVEWLRELVVQTKNGWKMAAAIH